MTMINSYTVYLSVVPITIILASSMVLGAITEFGNVGIAQGQANNATSTLTPQQRAVICSPTDKFVNDTESAICGIPRTPTPTNTTTSAANMTTTSSSANNNTSPIVP